MALVDAKPAVVSIPLRKILPNPRQPRRRFRIESIKEMADSLKTIGQQTPLKVRRLTAEEKIQHPPFEYLVVGGHRRRAGAELVEWRALDCIVLDILPNETHLAALMDNDLEQMDWWDWDLAIEVEARAQAVPSQKNLAERLGLSQTKVHTALKITKALSPNARALVTQNLDKAAAPGVVLGQPPVKTPSGEGSGDRPPSTSEKVPHQLTESTLLTLADLEDPLMVYRALKMVLDRHLGEPQVKKMVAVVKAGAQPEDFLLKGAPPGVAIENRLVPRILGEGGVASNALQRQAGLTSANQAGSPQKTFLSSLKSLFR